jgi:hypothetical protein
VKHHLIEFHKAMATLHKRHANSLEDDDPHASFHHEAAAHHSDLHKALLEPASNDPAMPHVGEEGRRGSNDLVPTKVHKVFNQPAVGRLIPRTGMESALEKAAVSPEMEDALGGL